MTDLSPNADATVSCLRCGAQNDGRRSTCDECGAPLVATSAEADRGDLELEEVWRSAGAGGFDTDFERQGAAVACPSCGASFEASRPALVAAVGVRDTASARDALIVATLRCPRCGTPGRLVTDADLLDSLDVGARSPAGTDGPVEGEGAAPRDGAAAGPADRPAASTDAADAAVTPGEVDWRHPRPPGSTPDRPLGADRRYFEEPAAPGGTLADQGELLDEEGDDIREYTGEPVETEEGWVVPQQQTAGPGNIAGGGEWPDPDTPSAQPGTQDEPRR